MTANEVTEVTVEGSGLESLGALRPAIRPANFAGNPL